MKYDLDQTNLVITHGSCPDGWGAAYAAWDILQENADYFFAYYGSPLIYNPEGKRIVFLDFCYDLKTMKDIASKCEWMVIIDHHITAQKNVEEELSKLDNVHCIFDMNHSGAVLSWLNFNPGECVPNMLRNIEDRDLYKWNIKNSKEYLCVFDTLELDENDPIKSFTMMDDFHNSVDRNTEEMDSIVTQGSAIIKAKDKMVRNLVERMSFVKTIKYGDSSEIEVAMVNCPFREMANEAARYSFEKWNTDIGIAFSFYENEVVFSVRGHNVFDCSAFAECFGGGGHYNASGFSRDFDSIKEVFL